MCIRSSSWLDKFSNKILYFYILETLAFMILRTENGLEGIPVIMDALRYSS